MKIKEKYRKKYTELSMTGNMPVNPKFLYEFVLPEDFCTALYVLSYTESSKTDFDICLNHQNKLVLTANTTPLVLCYKPERKDCNEKN